MSFHYLHSLQSSDAAASVFIRSPVEEDWQALLALHQASRQIHFPWVDLALTEEGCKSYIHRCTSDDFAGFLICRRDDYGIVGVANLSQIFYGVFQNAYLGYYAHAESVGRGWMSEGVRLVINYAFYTLNLHRLEANIQPTNLASVKLIKRLGFTKEGFSRRYLKIHGEWRDHERWALTVENWQKGKG